MAVSVPGIPRIGQMEFVAGAVNHQPHSTSAANISRRHSLNYAVGACAFLT